MENPYQSNTSVSHLDRDTRFFRTVLEIYKKYQGRDMPVPELAGMYVKSWLVSGILVMLVVSFVQWVGRDGVFPSLVSTSFIAGVFLGRVLRDFHHCRSTSRLWPIVHDVLNWERVDAQLEQLGSKES